MQKIENNKTSEKVVYTKKNKIVENFTEEKKIIGLGERSNGCWTSSAASIEDADAANQKLNPNANLCMCDPGTSWMKVSDSSQSQHIYGCGVPPTENYR
jgi:hypothetical protein